MQNDRFVRTKIRGDDGATICLRNGPADNFKRRLVSQFGVGFGCLIRSHFVLNNKAAKTWRGGAATKGARTALSAGRYRCSRNTRTKLSALLNNLRGACRF